MVKNLMYNHFIHLSWLVHIQLNEGTFDRKIKTARALLGAESRHARAMVSWRTAGLLLTLCLLVLHRRRSRLSVNDPTELLFIGVSNTPPLPPPPPVPSAALGPLPSHAALFERAFFVNADDSPRRRGFMEQQLEAAGVRYERWPAIRGSPTLLRTHRRYFARGVEQHLYANRSAATGTIVQWGTVGTYLSHLTLFESIVRRWGHNDSASFLILQDDTQMKRRWLRKLSQELRAHEDSRWARLLLVWWGEQRNADCRLNGWCHVRPPAGPTEKGQPECCGRRFYHGLQAWLVKTHSLKCIIRRLKRRRIKNIDAQMVQTSCPRTYALEQKRMLGTHLDRELGSERAAVNAVFRASISDGKLKASAVRNLRKTRLEHLAKAGGPQSG